MELEDILYGRVTVDEPVLVALLGSQAVRRLRGVLQHGITGLLGITHPVTRYDHSVGVMLLVRRLGARLDEQIAALLHDVSHTAFSHVIDHVLGAAAEQSYHEQVKADYVARTDLPDLLAAHGYDWRAFLHEDGYPLLEQPAPALCADRLDYFLRDCYYLKLAGAGDIAHVLAHLAVWGGQIVTDDLDVARWLAYTYLAADDASWSNFREVGLYEVTAEAIRLALACGAVEQADFWGTDRALWERLRAAEDPAVCAQVRLISPATQFVWDDAAPDFTVRTKLRTLDPAVLIDGAAQPLSALDPAFAAHRARYLARKDGAWPMRVVPPPAGQAGVG